MRTHLPLIRRKLQLLDVDRLGLKRNQRLPIQLGLLRAPEETLLE